MDTFTLLSMIIVSAVLITGILSLFNQPIVIGYIVTGVLLGRFLFNDFPAYSPEIFHVFSQMGIATLLFIVGLHLSPKEVKNFGKPAFLIGLFQVLITFSLGFLISKAFNFSTLSSLYIGMGLTFSSTIVVLKFLADKKDLEKLYGRITVVVLLLQDITAAIVLIAASAFYQERGGLDIFLLLIIKGLGLTILLAVTSYYILPKLSTFFAKSGEHLLLFSLGWGFGLASLFNKLGFSVEIGALIAGVVLSVSPYSEEISSKLKPIRDFFIILFFVSLGSQVLLENVSRMLLPLIGFSFFVLIIKPLIIIILSGMGGYKKKVGFFTGISLSQISEFSIILALIGFRSGHITEDVLSLITLSSIITIAISTYFIKYAENIYPRLAGFLRIFENKKTFAEIETLGGYDVILFGCNRVGYDFIKAFKHLKTRFLAVDFDPTVVQQLLKDGINVKYGDAEDGEFLEDIGVSSTKAVISTLNDYETNAFILSRAVREGYKTIVILTAHNLKDAFHLYDDGADYVIVPHFIGGQVVAKLAKDAVFGLHDLEESRLKHLEYLKERFNLGHV